MTSRSGRAFASIAIASVLVAACSRSGVDAGVGPVATTAPATAAVASPSVQSPPTTASAPTTALTSTPQPSATPVWEPKFDEAPVPANEPVLLAQQLAAVELALSDPSLSGAKLVWMGHMQQLAYSRLADFPDWRGPVLAALPASVRTAVTRSLDAGKELRKLHSGPPAKTLPDWKIVEPPSPETLVGYYREADAAFGVPWYYLAAIHLVETRMGRIRGLSVAGAQGPMQFIPATWAAYGEGDVNDPRDAIMGAARYLKAAGAPGNMSKALWAYNHSDFYVNAIALYADVMKADPAAYRGYYGWQVYYWTVDGPVFLPVGWVKE